MDAAYDTPRPRGGPLAGIRVLELTKVWAGPYAGKLLAFLGAEVIKVESRRQLDEMRAYGGVDIDNAPYFLSINQEVLSVQVNMKDAEGLDLLRAMIATADIVIDNLRPGAMERSGLDYDAVRKIKPDIIQIAIKMYGTDGPLGYQTGYAPCFGALGGLSSLVGHEGEPPRGMNIRYGDSTVGAAAAFAAIAALHHRANTGEGQFIDVSAVEAMSSMVGDSLFAYTATGEVSRADGNAHSEMAPHGCYPCAGDEWLSIAGADDREWTALCQVLEVPAMATDPYFATQADRIVNRQSLDESIAALTVLHPACAVAEKLLARGVPAFTSTSSVDLIGESQLWASGSFRTVTGMDGSPRPIIGPGWRLTPDDAAIERGAPLLGQHNDYVYRELLGLSGDELNGLIARKIVD